ncbi:MAG: N-acetyl sugar amidotransferase [Pseudomonadota bacterium]
MSAAANRQIAEEAEPLSVRVCARLVMDTTDPDITFDENGVCNYWHEFQAFKATLPTREDRERQREEIIAEIKAAGQGKEYDCVLGLSGGVDSSYLALLARDYGLRPLVVHLDNGWNSELAVNNIEHIVEKMGFDLQTHVLEWDQFRDLQRAYFKASVIDLEVPTDNLITGCLNRLAAEHGIKYQLSGNNYATEWLMPPRWNYTKHDGANMKAIHRRFGEKSIGKLPVADLLNNTYYHFAKGLRSVRLLNLIDFNKQAAKERLMAEVGWRDYGGKHYESIYTRFYQGYILPRKFGVDKRKAHLSNLILSGEITRDEALRELQQPTYDDDLKQRDKAYVAKKLGFSEDEFETLLSQENVPHEAYGSDEASRDLYKKVVTNLGKVKRKVTGQAKRRTAY